jgi:hypothetical protein
MSYALDATGITAVNEPRSGGVFLWSNVTTWFLLASGPSMCAEDAEAVRGRGIVLVINNTIELAPWADVLYSADPSWWQHYGERVAGFRGRRVGLRLHGQPDDVEQLPYRMGEGLGLDIINSGNNSGFQAINFAFLEGATRIVLLGYDMQHTGGRHHWHADHPRPLGNFVPGMPELCQPKFTALARDLDARGVHVINASRETALTCFTRQPLAEVLAQH